MRIFIGVTALAALVAIGGCKSNETKMAEARKEIGDSCRSQTLPGVDMNSYCTCVVDTALGGKSIPELEKMNEEQAKNMGMAAATQCLGKQGVGPGATPAAAPSDAAQQTGEAVEEGVDEAN